MSEFYLNKECDILFEGYEKKVSLTVEKYETIQNPCEAKIFYVSSFLEYKKRHVYILIHRGYAIHVHRRIPMYSTVKSP